MRHGLRRDDARDAACVVRCMLHVKGRNQAISLHGTWRAVCVAHVGARPSASFVRPCCVRCVPHASLRNVARSMSHVAPLYFARCMMTVTLQFDKIDAARCGSVSIQELQLARDSGHLPGVADRSNSKPRNPKPYIRNPTRKRRLLSSAMRARRCLARTAALNMPHGLPCRMACMPQPHRAVSARPPQPAGKAMRVGTAA